jgi:endonuclease VIII-like 1
MPELAEVKIMSEYINDVCEGEHFTSISFSESAMKRNIGIVQDSDLQIFEIKAESRGKELMLYLIQGGKTYMSISCSMGMTGNWAFYNNNVFIKHTHMKFNSVSGNTLCLVDMRCFAKWKVIKSWSINRGPCPLTEHALFIDNIKSSIHKRIFDKPIMEVMMDQKYFNGIGNYLRAEILYRHRDTINPFHTAREVLNDNPSLYNTIIEVIEESYVMGGGELKDWDNPYTRGFGTGRINVNKKKDAPKSFRDWLQCYQKEDNVIDKKGRRFWFDKKYESSADIYNK